MKSQKLIRVGHLLATRAFLKGTGGAKVLTLLVDTGSTYTIIPVEILEALGSSPAQSKDHVRIVTGNGILMVPRVVVPNFHCLGKELTDFQLIGHTLPPAGPIDGLLGMDFLSRFKARIHIDEARMELE